MKLFQRDWSIMIAFVLLLFGCKKNEKITFDELGSTLRGSWVSNEGQIRMDFISDKAIVIAVDSSVDTLGYVLSDYDTDFPSTKFHLIILKSCGDYLCPSHLHIRTIKQSVLSVSEYCDEESCTEPIVFFKKN